MSFETPTAPLTFDPADAFAVHAAGRLRDEKVAWLTTVGRGGAPAPNPVWFGWDGAGTVTVYTGPGTARLRHLAANPQVTLHFDSNGNGGDIVVLSGVAAVLPGGPGLSTGPDDDPAYLAKYADLIPTIGHTPATFAQAYGVRIEVTLTRLRGF